MTHIEETNPSASFILPDQTCQRLTLAEIESATNNFDEALVIGSGGFGKVYKSLSKFGLVYEVAIKRLHSTSDQGASEFEAEVMLLSKLRHGNLVPLIGYCSEGKELALAYEFMPNGTLKDHLHKGGLELSWLQLLKICIGAARGLDYLHTGTSTQLGVIHRDVKTSNILLDSNFAAKISDFGLAKIGTINQTRTHVSSTIVKGTFGYIDPCYFYTGKLTRKTDVYAFGVVLLEVLSGKQAVDPTLDDSLADWAKVHFKQGRLDEIVNHRLMGHISKKCLKGFARIAVQCLHNQPKQRPTMAEVVVKLESILSRERESVGSGVDDGRFINKVRYFFTGKAEGSRSEVSSTQYNQKSNSQSLRTFTYAEIESATNNFNDKELSTYSDETMYKGWVDELTYAPAKSGVGLAVYVRRRHIGTSELDLKPEEFSHPNLVKFLGYCLNEQELSSVYELPPDISLDKLLFGDPGTVSLSWIARLKIAVGAAQGLSFLHKRGHPAFRLFKTACILVDADYNARLRDFEVDNSFVALGSYSFEMDAYYAAPEWYRYQADVKLEGTQEPHQIEDGFGVKSEIYSFGVVLLEILTGMKVFDKKRPEGKQNLVKWATPLLAHEENLGMFLDPQLQDNNNNNHPPKGASKLALLVLNCLQPKPSERPSVEEIVQVLRHCKRKFDLMPVHAEKNTSKISSQYIQKSKNPRVGTFTYAELVSATDNFNDEEWSTNSLESFYKGWVDELTYAPAKSGVGLAMYVRRRHIGTSKLDLNPEEFNHPNLVKVLGYCLHNQQLSCVYELVPNASLDELLYGESGTTSLSWVARLKIAVGTAKGLSFLHKKGRPAYMQFKTACILVDAGYYARLRDFEVNNSFLALDSYTFDMGVRYAAPEWYRYQADVKTDGIFTNNHGEEGFAMKNEIYSFGVVLLELLTGMKVYDEKRLDGKRNLVKWATPLLADEVNLGEILDKELQDNNHHTPKGAHKLALLVLNCLQGTQSMEEILQVLRKCYLQQFF